MLLFLLAPAVASSAPCDLSTDEAVLAHYKAVTGKEIDTYFGKCVHRSQTFPKMIAVGSFATDYGCEWDGTFHGCTWNDKTAAPTEMAAAGWAKADTKKRTQLALAWLREVDQITIEDETVTATKGTLVVEFYEPGRVGMSDETPPRTHHRVTFGANGAHGKITRLR